MKRVWILLLLALLISPFRVFAQNEAEIFRIKAQIQTLEQEANGLERFLDEFHVALNERPTSNKKAIYPQLLSFDVKLIDMVFKIAVTRGVLESTVSGEASVDPIVKLQMLMLSLDKKSPLDFVRDMLLLISNGINTLKEKKVLLENTLRDNK